MQVRPALRAVNPRDGSSAVNKSYRDMMSEVHENNVNHGWYNDDRTYREALALLHSEVSEALEAYRQWGMKDATRPPAIREDGAWEHFKPEGVASELADVLIRMLDDAHRANVNLDVEMPLLGGHYGIEDRFGNCVDVMHNMISCISRAREDEWSEFETETGRAYARLLAYVLDLCDYHGIDLDAEYERKMAYNRTRGYRHGGKLL